MKDLQTKINEKAEERLNSDLDDFFNLVQKHKVNILDNCEDISVTIRTDDGQKTTTFRSGLWRKSDIVGKYLFSKLIQKYIEEETVNFINKVESLQKQIDSDQEQVHSIQQ